MLPEHIGCFYNLFSVVEIKVQDDALIHASSCLPDAHLIEHGHQNGFCMSLFETSQTFQRQPSTMLHPEQVRQIMAVTNVSMQDIPLGMQGLAVCPNLHFGLWSRLWDESHKPEDTKDDALLYGSNSAGGNAGAIRLLLAAALVGLAGLVPSGGYSQRNPSCTYALVGLLGAAVGLYLGLELFPGQLIIQVDWLIGSHPSHHDQANSSTYASPQQCTFVHRLAMLCP